MIDLTKLGAFPSNPTASGVPVRFGIDLPGITGADFQVDVLLIHRNDRFNPDIPARRYHLTPPDGSQGLWTGSFTVAAEADTNFGRPGRYLYRYQLQQAAPPGTTGALVTPWFTDPFAMATDDVGQLSAFDTPDTVVEHQWSAQDRTWTVPDLDKLIVYELHVEEFNGTFDGVVERLPYLRSLGVTCLELLPVTSLQLDFDWGYGPLHYFAPNERWGGAPGLRRLVDACHRAGVAVILDVVYQHVAETFPYFQVYQDIRPYRLVESPMIHGRGDFGPRIDYTRPFALEYVRTVNRHWLEEFHVDGFRYDEAGDLVDSDHNNWEPLATITRDTYTASLKLPRFTPSGGQQPQEYSRLIQVAEYLGGPAVLQNTYASATWQDNTLGRAEDATRTGGLTFPNDDFPHALDASLSGYPLTRGVHDINGARVEMPVAPFQYVNSHDHSHLVAFLTGDQFLTFDKQGRPEYHPLADRNRWYKLQPFVVALYTAAGIPMLWQGQEFTDNYVLPSGGDARIHHRRDVHWEYFYSPEGNPLIRLHRKMATLRVNHAALRGRDWYYYYRESRPRDGAFAYRRFAGNQNAIVLLNFSDSEQTVTVPCPAPGTYTESVDASDRSTPLQVTGAALNDPLMFSVPSNYGYVYIRP